MLILEAIRLFQITPIYGHVQHKAISVGMKGNCLLQRKQQINALSPGGGGIASPTFCRRINGTHELLENFNNTGQLNHNHNGTQ